MTSSPSSQTDAGQSVPSPTKHSLLPIEAAVLQEQFHVAEYLLEAGSRADPIKLLEMASKFKGPKALEFADKVLRSMDDIAWRARSQKLGQGSRKGKSAAPWLDAASLRPAFKETSRAEVAAAAAERPKRLRALRNRALLAGNAAMAALISERKRADLAVASAAAASSRSGARRRPALYEAAGEQNDFEKALRLLFSGEADPFERVTEGMLKGWPKSPKSRVGLGAEERPGFTALHRAAQLGHGFTVLLLVVLVWRGSPRWTPEWVNADAAMFRKILLKEDTWRWSDKEVEPYVRSGREHPKLPSCVDCDGSTPVHVAVKANADRSIVRKLLAARPDWVNVPDRWSMTPLDYALKAKRSAIAQLLVLCGGEPGSVVAAARCTHSTGVKN
ncbi:hypothetical protein DFJ73DRAFT_925516 [Zopfochytrium polystomum]|nr:hypothetical protein DFJ73DRAFT_925516 [Zopfochytrium polystomum]